MKKVALLCLLLCLFLAGCKATMPAEKAEVYFFHESICASCDERGKLEGYLSRLPVREYRIHEYSVFQPACKQAVESLHAFTGVYVHAYPLLVIGNTVLSGYEEIEKGFIAAIDSYKPGFDPEKVKAPTAQGQYSYPAVPKDKDYGVFFTTEACSDCEKAKKVVQGTITVDERSIAGGDNVAILQDFFTRYGVPKAEQRVPILFLRNTYLSGERAIADKLGAAIKAGEAQNFAYPQASGGGGEISILATMGTGLVNGLNPCALSMLFLLLSVLVNMKQRVIGRGLTYLLGKIVAYFGLGLLLCLLADSLSIGWLSGVRIGGAVLLIGFSLVFALGNLLDFRNAAKEKYGKIRMQLPAFLRKWNSNAIERVASGKTGKWILPILFVLGLVISAGELLCTGQIYLASILYAAQSQGTIPILHLLVYVVFMCIPSLAAVLFVGAGKRVMEISELSRRHMPTIKLINAILFILFAVLGLWMLF